jgi:hypothetical protein
MLSLFGWRIGWAEFLSETGGLNLSAAITIIIYYSRGTPELKKSDILVE